MPELPRLDCSLLVRTELWGVDNNLNISNMDWAEFADAVDESGVFRGFPA